LLALLHYRVTGRWDSQRHKWNEEAQPLVIPSGIIARREISGHQTESVRRYGCAEADRVSVAEGLLEIAGNGGSQEHCEGGEILVHYVAAKAGYVSRVWRHPPKGVEAR